MNGRRCAAALAALVLTAALGVVPALAAGYTDVPEDAWYAPAAEWCRENGILDGGTTFDPSGAATRGAVVDALYRLAGAPDGPADVRFPDVPERYAAAVAWAARTGVAAGYDAGRFGPDDPVTRQQLAVFLWRYSGSPKAGDADPFADSSAVSAYALEAVRWARSTGAVNGYADGRFDPWGGATRAHLAQILMNFGLASPSLPTLEGLPSPSAPTGLAVTPDGAVLAADGWNKVIWRVQDGSGAVFAGGVSQPDAYGEPAGGNADGAPGLFARPWAVAPWKDGWAVSDADNDAIRLITVSGLSTLNIGFTLSHPTGLTTDDEGNLYIADTWNGVIRRASPSGAVSTAASGLDAPMGLCWHGGALYAAETGANRIVRIADGKTEVLAGSGTEGLTDGPAESAEFAAPQAVAAGDDGTIYVADTLNSAVRRIRDGAVDTLLVRDPASLEAGLVSPAGLLVHDGKLYVSDSFSGTVFVLPL